MGKKINSLHAVGSFCECGQVFCSLQIDTLLTCSRIYSHDKEYYFNQCFTSWKYDKCMFCQEFFLLFLMKI